MKHNILLGAVQVKGLEIVIFWLWHYEKSYLNGAWTRENASNTLEFLNSGPLKNGKPLINRQASID